MILEVFPVQTGVILYDDKNGITKVGIPRTGGGDPVSVDYLTGVSKYSPHRRG